MKNTAKQYLHDFARALRVEPTIKKKIVSDIGADIETKLSQGETMQDILAVFGSPKQLAQEFNQNYPEYAAAKQIKTAKIAALVGFLVAACCGIIGVAGRYLLFHGDTVSRVGGVDFPTQIVTSAAPISVLYLFDILLTLSLVAIGMALIGVGYWVVEAKSTAAGR